jgi:HEAT repeat protein
MNMQSNLGGFAPPPNTEDEGVIQKMSETPEASPDELLPYAKVTKTELPDCSKQIPQLARKSWWLTRQTWTFQPEEMRDLEFQPAVPVFAEKLNTKYGYYTAANLALLEADAVPALITALQNTNPTVRLNAISTFESSAKPLRDPRLKEASVTWLKDPNPQVRKAAVYLVSDYSEGSPKFTELLIGMLKDEDAGVRHAAAFCLHGNHDGLSQYIPAFQQMLKDTNAGVRVSGMKMLRQLQVPIPREELLSFFKLPDREVIGITLSQFRKADGRGRNLKYDISDEEAIPLLQNTEPLARMIGLNVIYKNAEKQSIELALPLLKDPQPVVRRRAAATLRALTGQHFTEDQSDQWGKWWMENKTNFIVELHPEELRPQRRGTNDFHRYFTNRPPTSVP